MFSFAVNAPTILDPSWSLWDPALLTAKISYSLISSWFANLINISSWVVASPIVTSVPKWIKWRVVGDIKVSLDAVGLPTPVAIAVGNPEVVVDALVVSLAVIPEFHVKVLPLATVATNTWPKLFKDQRPGSRVTVDASTALPHPV